MGKKVMIVTGEASGDLHGANLVRALQEKDPTLQFAGMGGLELGSLGVEILFDADKVSVVGVVEVIAHLSDIFKAQKILRAFLENERPDLVILIDLPDFNLLLAKKAKKLGIPVFYYICPQVWAWRTGRIKTLKERADRFGVILPFEEQFFRQRGLDATYVGHPLLDEVSSVKSPKEFKEYYGIQKTKRLVGILPGSRAREVESLLPVFLEAALLLEKAAPGQFSFVIPKAASVSEELFYRSGLADTEGLDIHIIEDDRYDLMAACECVMAASGTVSLELALLHTPMVIAYRLSPLTYRLARLLVKIEFFSLVNLIAGREVVAELLQQEVQPETIAYKLKPLLFSYPAIKAMKEDLVFVNNRLGTQGASKRAAQVALDMLG